MSMESRLPAFDLSHVEVVVVDDCPIMLKLLGLILNSMDIKKVHGTTDPVRALEDISKYRPHLVITDLLMDSIDGVTVTKTIRFSQDAELRHTPIFVLSGFTDKEHVLRARDAGVNEVLAKPVSTKTIYRRICNLIERPPQFIETDSYFGPDRQPSRANLANSEQRIRQAVGADMDHICFDAD
jgi:two-component system, chemotaxis family, chemotaxis protein CheY